MNSLDKANIDKFDNQIEHYRDEIRLREELNEFYQKKYSDNPSLKYILVTWITCNRETIDELNITIQYLQQEKENFLQYIENKSLPNEK